MSVKNNILKIPTSLLALVVHQCKLRLLAFREAAEHFGSYATLMSRRPQRKSFENNILQLSNAR